MRKAKLISTTGKSSYVRKGSMPAKILWIALIIIARLKASTGKWKWRAYRVNGRKIAR